MNDFLLDSDFDLMIKDGDFLLGESNQQHQQSILLAEKGAFKQHPTLGVGLFSFLKNENPNELLREIRLEFDNDGMKIKRIGFEGGKLKIDADYGK